MITEHDDARIQRRLDSYILDALDKQERDVLEALRGSTPVMRPFMADEDGEHLMLAVGFRTAAHGTVYVAEVDARTVGITFDPITGEFAYEPDPILDDDLPEVAAWWTDGSDEA